MIPPMLFQLPKRLRSLAGAEQFLKTTNRASPDEECVKDDALSGAKNQQGIGSAHDFSGKWEWKATQTQG